MHRHDGGRTLVQEQADAIAAAAARFTKQVSQTIALLVELAVGKPLFTRDDGECIRPCSGLGCDVVLKKPSHFEGISKRVRRRN